MAWGRWALLLVVALVLCGPAWAFDGPGPQGPPVKPPKAPGQAQQCMEQYLANQAACHDIWCSRSVFYYVLWFVEEDCNELYLHQCILDAELVFMNCMAAG